jgi:hypothetical protein
MLMYKFILKVERFAKNPHLEVIVGFILMASGFNEAGEAIFEDITSGEIGAHHGMILLGFATMVRFLPSVLLGFTIFAHAKERE